MKVFTAKKQIVIDHKGDIPVLKCIWSNRYSILGNIRKDFPNAYVQRSYL